MYFNIGSQLNDFSGRRTSECSTPPTFLCSYMYILINMHNSTYLHIYLCVNMWVCIYNRLQCIWLTYVYKRSKVVLVKCGRSHHSKQWFPTGVTWGTFAYIYYSVMPYEFKFMIMIWINESQNIWIFLPFFYVFMVSIMLWRLSSISVAIFY